MRGRGGQRYGLLHVEPKEEVNKEYRGMCVTLLISSAVGGNCGSVEVWVGSGWELRLRLKAKETTRDDPNQPTEERERERNESDESKKG